MVKDIKKRRFSISALPSNAVLMDVDLDKLEKIVSNLLSNALKFTPDGGGIKVSVSVLEELKSALIDLDPHANWIEIRVTDTGEGIPKDRIKFIFDRFYQVDGAHHREQEGTGIGLSLTKELVELHGGGIHIDSKEGKGTKAYVYLPFEGESYKREAVESAPKDRTDLLSQLESTVGFGTKISSTAKAGQSAPLILIVEDNVDVSAYIRDKLEDKFRIKEAVNGKDGLEIAIDSFPDVIISDIMMPVMDGIELTKSLKNDQRTSHIPVILLTAKAEDDDVLQGLDIGSER